VPEVPVEEKVASRSSPPVAYEIAILGRNGLDINDPAEKYTLKTMPGTFSGLNPTFADTTCKYWNYWHFHHFCVRVSNTFSDLVSLGR
jgi:hypothetical protein